MRNAGRIKLGYYPLPTGEAHKIRNLLAAPVPYVAIDPCAGDGSALMAITANSPAWLAAIELDADRAAACAAKGISAVHGSVFECRVAAESCSLLYLNPPYDTELGPYGNQRMELVFLEHCNRWLATGGVLVFIVPSTALAPCARLLASQFDHISVWRLEHPESVRFHQVAILGRRKKAHARGEPKGAEFLIRAGSRFSDIPVLGEQETGHYQIPPSQPGSIQYLGLPLDVVEDALEQSLAMQKARGVLIPKHQKMSGRPVTPLHEGHVGLLACSGMLNGFFGQGEMRHIAHWRAVKYVDEVNEEGEQEGETVIHRRERFSHELTLAYEDGRIVELRETAQNGSKHEERA
jgi:predicted RNA methylase